MKIKVLFSSLFLIVLSSALSAQTATPGVTDRQINQQKRITQGVRSGELTKKETARLQVQQRQIQKHKQAVKADGVVTKRERTSLQVHQNKASRTIQRKKNN